jgi:hypothetical protein
MKKVMLLLERGLSICIVGELRAQGADADAGVRAPRALRYALCAPPQCIASGGELP